jgi:hypothetical protein
MMSWGDSSGERSYLVTKLQRYIGGTGRKVFITARSLGSPFPYFRGDSGTELLLTWPRLLQVVVSWRAPEGSLVL